MFRAAFFFFSRGWVPFLEIPKFKEGMEMAMPVTVVGAWVKKEGWRKSPRGITELGIEVRQ